jgi:hypothetical protein
MNMARTVMTAGLLNPATACSGETRPVRARAARTMIPTRSADTQPPMNRTRAARTMNRRIRRASMGWRSRARDKVA